MDRTNLTNKKDAIEFYNGRYNQGYMEEWPIEKRQRVLNVIRNLNLPETGDALDFGCGNGGFTSVIKQALLKWNVYGLDISSIAITNAKKEYPDCLFFLQSDLFLKNKRFDFLFTHHVLEHVQDISETWREINGYLNKIASILHILPCANKGSFEYNLCLLNKAGIGKEMNNKFFFEDTSHLRRLNTEQMNHYATQYGFNLKVDYYSNQFYGAINWITLISPALILEMTNPNQAKDIISALKLAFLGIVFLIIKVLRFPSNTIDYKKKKMRSFKYYLSFFMLLMFYPLSKTINIFIKYKSDLEWKKTKSKKNGSEMYLYYTRTK